LHNVLVTNYSNMPYYVVKQLFVSCV